MTAQRIVFVALLMTACNDSPASKPPPAKKVESPDGKASTSASKAAPANSLAGLQACRVAVRALDAEARCSGGDSDSAKQLRELLADPAPLDDAGVRERSRWCWLLAGERLDALVRRACTYSLTEDERAAILAERSRRTKPPAGINAEDRLKLDDVVTFREKVCACQDSACVASVMASVNLPPFDPGPLRDAANAMIEEADVCHRRLERR